MKSSSRGWRQRVSVPCAAAMCAAVIGCGGSGSGDVTAAQAPSHPPGPCRTGGSILPHVPDAPAAWSSGPRPAVALTCSSDEVDPGAAIVGYPIPGGGSCVSAYSSSLGEAFGELCEPSGTGWTSQCERPGCVHYFSHKRGSTVLAGPVLASVTGVWAGIHSKQVLEGVVLASVHDKRLRAMGAKEPFGYFGVYIPRCVESDEVKIHLVAGGDEQIGLADEWDVSEPPCPEGSKRPSS